MVPTPHRAAWPDFSVYRPYPDEAVLARWLAASQALTLALFASIEGPRLTVPLIPIVNPPLWELGHVGWFQEFWLHRRGDFEAPSLLPGADSLYDSSRVAHDTRWSLELPDLAATHRYLEAVFHRSMALLSGGALSDESAYFAQLSIFHQDMHNEAFCYMWQTLGYPLALSAPPEPADPGESAGDIEIPAGAMELGARPEEGFVFDNEKWAHPITLPAFAIARHAVSNAEFAAFAEDGGYQRREFWSEAGWRMREQLQWVCPRYWRKDSGAWRVRRFDRELPLAPGEPVMHVSFHEAEAYCRWAGRRLPSEAEWERAAATAPGEISKRRYPWGEGSDAPIERLARLDARWAGPAAVRDYPGGISGWGAVQMLGNVWEWTASPFAPYPGFAADPYRDYSAPWFGGDYRVLRGGSFVTPRRLIRNTWRNFYKPERADLFCGFRTCAL